MSLFAFLADSARRYGGAGAVFHGTRLHATYAELHRRALALGAALREGGRAGDRVLVASANCPEYPEIMFGIWAAGMVAVPVNAKLHPREIGDIAADSGVAIGFASPELACGIGAFVPELVPIGSDAYARMLGCEAAAPAERGLDDLAWLFFTSGTTGRAKGAMLSHRNLIALSVAHVADLEPVEAGHAIIHAAPMSHGSGLYLLPYTMRGARHVVPASGGFDPGEFLDLADHHSGAGAFLAPTMVRRLRLHMAETGRGHGLRSIVYGGGPMYLEELKASLAAFGPILCQLYAQGETPMTATGLRRQDHIDAPDAVLASVGWPRSGVQLRIVDADDRELPPGEIGEILCRSDVVMQGYWNNAEATAAALRGGWLHTGDMGCLDETGMLTLRDRSKDVIISGGTNIYPREVEEVLLSHPGVAEVCVVGARDPDWGETVVAVIVREKQATVDAAALERHCIERIARFKRPKRYLFVEALPKSSYGKVLKRELAPLVAPSQESVS